MGIKLKIVAPELDLEFTEQQIIDWFHDVYVRSPAAQNPIHWFGCPMQKNPMDMWIYQEIIVRCQPDIIIETGTDRGASALYMAMICDIIGKGRIISIDIKERDNKALHPRIKYLIGDSVSQEIINLVIPYCVDKSVMVVLDSDHTKQHVLKELDQYGPLVTKGQYLIVEDTQINGHPVGQNFGEGPWEAIEEWLPKHPEFIQDKECERFLLTWNPNGYLKRI